HTLLELFGDRRQLIVVHFMFDPSWDEGCSSCTAGADEVSDGLLAHLRARDTRLVYVARAPLEKIEVYRSQRGWTFPWYSSFGSDFNYDYHVTLDESKAPIEYNYMNKEELEARRGKGNLEGEDHGLSVFFRVGDDLFHTYSCYARGTENLTNTYELLDV